MVKLGLLATVFGTIAALAVATLSPSPANADPSPCQRKEAEFKTEMVKAACLGTKDKPGNQEAAKDAMKKFNKDHNIKSCNECHSKLAPTYELKDTGLKRYQELGGK